MFTGLIEEVGHVAAIAENGAGRELIIAAPTEFLREVKVGDSVSVSGICLTAVEVESDRFRADVVEETLRRTSLGDRRVGDRVNLERALLASGRFGGHIVQGHVDGVGSVVNVRAEGDGLWITIEPVFELMKYIVEKGSVCLDGISLTVANVAYSRFSVALIPHTLQSTTAGDWAPGSALNIEVDIVAKYVERLTLWNV